MGTASPTRLSSPLPHPGGPGTWPCPGEAAAFPGLGGRSRVGLWEEGPHHSPLCLQGSKWPEPLQEPATWPRGQPGGRPVAVLSPPPTTAPLSSAPRPRQYLFPRICSETRQLFHNPERRVGIDEDKSKDACPQPRPPRPRRATAGYSTVTGTFTRAGGPTASSKPDFPQEHTADLPTFPPKKQMPRTARGLPGR